MAGSVHTAAYMQLLKQLVDARANAGVSQAQLAKRIAKPASFVVKYELGERRLDVVELLVVLKALGADNASFISDLNKCIPPQL